MKIGLETHVQLNLKTKLFCACSLTDVQSAEPNTRVCEICLGHPGSKPRLNRGAVEAAIKIALALNCSMPQEMFFSRKTYLYPDMSKNYQITQFEIPVASSGQMDSIDERGAPRKIEITRINIEEDPAQIKHVGGSITTARYTLIDYNRSGIPLCEIVTEPVFKSPKEARLYLQRLMGILEYLGVFEPEDFSLKSDANISMEGERVEIKNITGFREVERALNYEIIRQKKVLREGGIIERETRAWDAGAGVTRLLRKKETEEDYGYIFEPDLTNISLSLDLIEKMRRKLPELPHQKLERYKKQFGISSELAASISSDLSIALFYEKLTERVNPKTAASWMLLLKKTLNYKDLSLSEAELSVFDFAKLIENVESGKLSDLGGEEVLRALVAGSKLDDALKKFSILPDKEVKKLVEDILQKEKSAVSAYKSGDKKALQFLIGEVVDKSGRKADAKVVESMIKEQLDLDSRR